MAATIPPPYKGWLNWPRGNDGPTNRLTPATHIFFMLFRLVCDGDYAVRHPVLIALSFLSRLFPFPSPTTPVIDSVVFMIRSPVLWRIFSAMMAKITPTATTPSKIFGSASWKTTKLVLTSTFTSSSSAAAFPGRSVIAQRVLNAFSHLFKRKFPSVRHTRSECLRNGISRLNLNKIAKEQKTTPLKKRLWPVCK